MKKIKAAIIGCGVIAPTHIEAYQKISCVEVTWLCDKIKTRAERLAIKYDIPNVAADYKKVLADPDLTCVSVCTDHKSHAAIAVEAFKKGKHVLCEKALAANRADLNKMLTEYKKRKHLVFSGVFQNRFTKDYHLVERLVAEGALGKMLRGDLQFNCLRTDAYYESDEWRGTWAKEGGSLLINQAVHFIDLLVWIMGGVKRVAGTYANVAHKKTIETEDLAAAFLRFKNGAVGTISATSASNLIWDSSFCFCGTEGTLELKNGAITRLECNNKMLVDSIIEEHKRTDEKIQVSGPGKNYYGPGHNCQIADFTDCIRTGSKLFVTGDSAAHTVSVVLGIYESHRKKTWACV